MVTAETAPFVKRLKADLQRIVNSANEELRNIRCAGLVDSTRQAEEARVIHEARAFAVRRVESTVRDLHTMKSQMPPEHRPINGFDEAQKSTRPKLAPTRADLEQTAVMPILDVLVPGGPVAQPAQPREPVEGAAAWKPAADSTGFVPPAPEAAAPVVAAPGPRHAAASDDTEVLEELATLLREFAPLAEDTTSRHAALRADDTEPTPQPQAAETGESESERLQRLLNFVARQEPGVRWAVGTRDDGTTLLVTDLAYGWIPPGITLPDEVRLLEPGRRTGGASALLGPTASLATYAPGDPLGWATDYRVTDTSSRPRELPAIDDLGWLLGQATHWRDGLPRMVNTLARAGAAGSGIVDAEIDILRVYLDTSRYQLLAQYPDVDTGQLMNCLLLATTEALAAKNMVSANYHFAWFQLLSSPPPGNWKAGP